MVNGTDCMSEVQEAYFGDCPIVHELGGYVQIAQEVSKARESTKETMLSVMLKKLPCDGVSTDSLKHLEGD